MGQTKLKVHVLNLNPHHRSPIGLQPPGKRCTNYYEHLHPRAAASVLQLKDPCHPRTSGNVAGGVEMRDGNCNTPPLGLEKWKQLEYYS